eukprot:TRINITY_DN4420_c0_g1_i2.p1 TRINITY_DN4420_c0_g1~~TRINITY_DN4420_c0_g1_i2.p1  ORF type:complete len:248 (-),score=46.23 TRINITY_DN4420_c0_g1_i2:58-801(-)
MNYLHSNWVIHRDLKPSNILVLGKGPEEGTVKIADFGLARIFQSPLRPLSDNGVVVTIWYRAPELLLGSKHYTKAIDIWAIGCIFAELMNRKPLFPGKEKDPRNPKAFQEDQLQKIFSVLGKLRVEDWSDAKFLPDFPKISEIRDNKDPNLILRNQVKGVTPNAYDLLQKMLDYDPNKRISAEKALDHPYFHDLPKPSLNSFAYVESIDHYPVRQVIKQPPPPLQQIVQPPNKKKKMDIQSFDVINV